MTIYPQFIFHETVSEQSSSVFVIVKKKRTGMHSEDNILRSKLSHMEQWERPRLHFSLWSSRVVFHSVQLSREKLRHQNYRYAVV